MKPKITQTGLFAATVLFFLVGNISAAEKNPGHKYPSAYGVAHSWPDLPEDYMFGQVPGVAIDSHNRVVVFNRVDHYAGANRISKNDEPIGDPTIIFLEGETGRLVKSWGTNLFLLPHGLRVDRDDNIWVTDVGLHQVLKFSPDGKLLLSMGVKGEPGLDAAHFNKPTDVAFAADGSVYVSDGYGNNRVAKFSAQGKFLFDWGQKGSGPGEFDLPHGITIDSQDRLYVADRSNGRVQVFRPDGKFLSEWKSAELGRPWGLTIGPDSLLYVVDGGDMRAKPPDRAHVLKLDLRGNILDKWARYGNYNGQLYWGHAIAVGKKGEVYVGDILGQRIQKFIPAKANR